MIEVKTKFYELLAGLGYRIKDNPYTKDEEETFPCLKLTISDAKRIFLKDGSFKNLVIFKIDIFSKYDGEKEILEIEQKIADLAPALYEIDSVMNVLESGFKIIDDTSLKVRMKHGVINYSVLLAGQTEIQEDNEEENNG